MIASTRCSLFWRKIKRRTNSFICLAHVGQLIFWWPKKTPLALSWKSFSQRSYLCETFGSVNTQIKPEVATSCFVPDTCGVAWSVRLTADSRAAWSGISAFRDISISSQEQAYWKETGQACIWRPSFSNWTSWIHTLTTQVSISYGFRFSTALILQRSETERIYMKRASTSKLIWIQTQFFSQNKKAKDLLKISESSTVMKSENSTCFWQLPRRMVEAKLDTILEISVFCLGKVK